MTVVSKPVPTFKPNWLRKDNPSRGRRPKTWHGYYPCVTKFRRQPKGRRAKSGQWWRRVAPFRAWLGVDLASGGDKTVYRMEDGTIRVKPSRSNEP